KTEEEEFMNIYNMRVTQIPTNKPVQRIDNTDKIYATEKIKLEAVTRDVIERHSKGQPILIGTVAVETSEVISNLLKIHGIRHNVLNAKNHGREAEIIKDAGKKGAVTIATNMAGRGTDIKLGEAVIELGGLAVIGTERHESRRIDDHLRGRSGRQGDVGQSRFYVSLQDERMVRFDSERMESLMGRLDMNDDTPIESKMVSRAVESAQKRVEGNNFDARKRLLEYDDVLRQQREIIYGERNDIIENDNVENIVKGMIKSSLERGINYHLSANEDDIDYEALVQYIEDSYLQPGVIKADDIRGRDYEDIQEIVLEKIKDQYKHQQEEFGDQMSEFERMIVLRTI